MNPQGNEFNERSEIYRNLELDAYHPSSIRSGDILTFAVKKAVLPILNW